MDKWAALALSVAGVIIGLIAFPEGEAAALTLLATAGIEVGVDSSVISFASFIASFQTSPEFNISKKDLLSYLISVQQSFAVGKGSNTDEVKILRYRYRFENSGSDHYLNWPPFYLASDYNFYNDDNISFQIKHSGIDGTVKGFKKYDDVKDFFEQ